MTSCGLTSHTLRRFTTRNFYDDRVKLSSKLDPEAHKV
jgi:hypothetical protein